MVLPDAGDRTLWRDEVTRVRSQETPSDVYLAALLDCPHDFHGASGKASLNARPKASCWATSAARRRHGYAGFRKP